MTRAKFPCKYHPENLSARKCFQCKRYICPDCQKKLFHHIFCSVWCIVKYTLREKILKYKYVREYGVLILIMLIIQIVFFAFHDHHGEIEIRENGVDKRNAYRDSIKTNDYSHHLRIDTVFTGFSQSLVVTGMGRPNELYGLWHNGKFASSTISNNGKISFPAQSMYIGKNEFVIWALTKQGQSVLVDSFFIDYTSQRIKQLARSFEKLPTSDKILALTFDGGSAATGTDSLIKVLEEKDVQSTIFLTGGFVRNFPGIVKKLLDHKHELANHTFSHPHLTSYENDRQHITLGHVNRDYIFNQLNKTDSLVFRHFAEHLKPYWRAPFGEYNEEILTWAAELGYKHISWSPGCDTRDWVSDEESSLYRTSNEIYEYLLKLESRGRLKGAVILFHLHSDRDHDMPYKMLPKLIDSLRKRGYKLVTISQLLTSSIAS